MMMNLFKTMLAVFITCFYATPLLAQEWVGTDYVSIGDAQAVQLLFSENTDAPRTMLLESGVTRLVLDWTKMSTAIKGQDIGSGQKAIDGEGVVSRLRYAKRGQKGMRLVFELSSGAKFIGTESFGDSLLVKFAKTERASPISAVGLETINPITDTIPNPRIKSPLSGQQAVLKNKGVQSTKELKPHNPFHYKIPMPRIKPFKSGEGQATQSVARTSTLADLNIYTPKKRVFKESERPYPRTAPHLDVSRQNGAINALGLAAPATLRKPMIVIDPGHGGYDPGAIGAKGTKEKLITSRFSKRLAAALLKTGLYEISLTRTKDVYVEHEDRLRIARELGAGLFISVHADSTENGKASGASVYTLA